MTAPRIGFSCLWDRDAPRTWSHTPWRLREAMRRHGDVVDTGVSLSDPVRFGLQGLHARWRDGVPMTIWQQSRLTDFVVHRQVVTLATRRRCHAVLQMQDLAPVDLPFFVYQDMSFDALMQLREAAGLGPRRDISAASLQRRRDRQLRVYEKATGVFAMSGWLARSLVERTGLPPSKIHVVPPGTTAVHDGPIPDRPGPRRRLLFVGRGDFHGKGGDLVVAALAILRREVDPAITLTIAGPHRWPRSGDIPDGVTFLGHRPADEIAKLYDTHDLFVMPSRQEAFGIAFAEATGRGLPCVARNAWAMPEIVVPEVNGALVEGDDDPAVLADVVATALADNALYAACRAAASATRRYFSWDRAGRQAVDIITAELSASRPASVS